MLVNWFFGTSMLFWFSLKKKKDKKKKRKVNRAKLAFDVEKKLFS